MPRVAPILDAVAALSGTRESATALAHDIGYLLPTASDDTLGDLRNALLETGVQDDAVSAMLIIMAEMVDGFRTAMARANDEKKARQVLGEGIHRDIAEQLLRAPQSTSQLARKLRKDSSEISRALKRMREFDIVDPPSREVLDQRRAVHRLSLRGQRLAETSRDRPRKPQTTRFTEGTKDLDPHFAEGTETVQLAEGTQPMRRTDRRERHPPSAEGIEIGQFPEGALDPPNADDPSNEPWPVEDMAPRAPPRREHEPGRRKATKRD